MRAGGGQDQHVGVKGDKVDLQDVIFRSIGDIHSMAGSVRTTNGGEYQKNADNYFYLVHSLWSTVHYMLSKETKEQALTIIDTARRMYVALKEKNGGSMVSFENQDEVTNITFLASVRIFQIICDDLHKKGYLAEARKGVVIGRTGLFDQEETESRVDADDELNAPDPDGEVGDVGEVEIRDIEMDDDAGD